jgi:hypothetical protein
VPSGPGRSAGPTGLCNSVAARSIGRTYRLMQFGSRPRTPQAGNGPATGPQADRLHNSGPGIQGDLVVATVLEVVEHIDSRPGAPHRFRRFHRFRFPLTPSVVLPILYATVHKW